MLTSLQNPLVKQMRKLHQAKERREQQLFLLEGTHLLTEACAVNYPLVTVCCTPAWQEHQSQLWQLLSEKADRTEIVSAEVLGAIASTVNPDGIVATAKRLPLVTYPQTKIKLGLALETLQDPGNLGTIIRTAAAANVQSLWLSADSVDVDHPKVLRASAGAWFHLPMVQYPDLKTEILDCKKQGIQIIGTLPQAEQVYWEVNFQQPSLILLGNEGAGLSADLIALTDQQVKIPISARVESLNVAIAAALILYEAQRQHHLMSSHSGE